MKLLIGPALCLIGLGLTVLSGESWAVCIGLGILVVTCIFAVFAWRNERANG